VRLGRLWDGLPFGANHPAQCIAVSPTLADPDENNCAEQMHDSHQSGRIRPLDQSEVVRTVGCSCPDRPESERLQYLVARSTTSPFFPQIARTKLERPLVNACTRRFSCEKHVETCVRLHQRTLTMSVTTVGGALKEASGASKKSLQKAIMQTYACFNMFFTRKTPRTCVYEGSCKFLYERFGGKRARGGSSNEVYCAGVQRVPSGPTLPRGAPSPLRAAPAASPTGADAAPRVHDRHKSRHPKREPLPFTLPSLNRNLNGSDSRPRPVQVHGSSLVFSAVLATSMGLNC